MISNCPECDSEPTSWTWFAQAESSGPFGPVVRNPSVSMVLGCDECSETLVIIGIDDWLTKYNLWQIHLEYDTFAVLEEHFKDIPDEATCLTVAQDREMRRLLNTPSNGKGVGSKIEAIKYLRHQTKMGLKEAKEYVEATQRGEVPWWPGCGRSCPY